MGFGDGAHAAGHDRSHGIVPGAETRGVALSAMDDVLERLAVARAQLLRGEVAAKGTAIAGCVGSITTLREGLDARLEPALRARLEALYEHLSQRLLQANLRDDAVILDEVGSLLGQLRDSWAQLGPAPSPAVAR